jgi:hypothetical protein
MSAWLAALEPGAPDLVAAFRGVDEGRFITVRREVRRRAGGGTAEGLVGQLGVVAEAIATLVGSLPEDAFGLPGGEGDWTVAECVGHDAAARAGLAMAAGLAASGRWPADAPTVVPGVPGPVADRDALVAKLAQSQRIIGRSARSVAGHETDACPLEHPLVGRLRCGEWLLFAGVHDLMHLEQLHRLADELAAAELVAGAASVARA